MREIILVCVICSQIFQIGCGAAGGECCEPYRPLDQNSLLGVSLLLVNNPQRNDTISVDNLFFSWETSAYMLSNTDTLELERIQFFHLGIFTHKIAVKFHEITNIENMVWGWHSGLDEGRNGSVLFEEGFDFNGGNIVTDSLTQLQPDSIYYWAVWGWDSRGYLVASSPEMFFFTK